MVNIENPYEIIRTCPEHLCRIFTREKFVERSDAGEFRLYFWPKANPKPFTPFRDMNGELIVRSEEVLILDERFPPGHHRNEVMRSHCYITENGKIGASKKLDPKEITIGNANYRGLKKTSCKLCEGEMIPPEERFRNSTYRPVPRLDI